MNLQGKLYAESPIYRGNARKTLFTRDGDGRQRLVSLAGEIAGTAQALMDAFIGHARNSKNIGLLDQLWLRLYDSPLPGNLITHVECRLQEQSYPRDNFFDLRMGIKLDEDRWAAEANANYKYETLYRNSVFDFTMAVNDAALNQGENATRLYYVLKELEAARFWFGAGKSKGLGRCRLEMDLPFAPSGAPPHAHAGANHLRLALTFSATNPVLVGWNWGKVDPENVPAFASIEGRLLVEAMHAIPEPIRERLEMGIGGPILSPESWKKKLAEYLPRVIAIWLQERSSGEVESWTFPGREIAKLGKGKNAISMKVFPQVQALSDRPFASQEAAEAALREALGDKQHAAKRILKLLEHTSEAGRQFDREAWDEVASSLGIDGAYSEQLAAQIQDEAALAGILAQACKPIWPQLYEQVDQQIKLVQSDAWVDAELTSRQEHLRIKMLLREGKIGEQQWGDREQVPEGVSASAWREFLEAHRRVHYRHMLDRQNLSKSIANDHNFIGFLKNYRDRTRQELARTDNIDFRIGGASRREVSRQYGKPYDTIFMRMLAWAPSRGGEELWEVYIPGSTIKGAFRKRASQVLKTLWGESGRTNGVLNRLFGEQGRRGLVFFSDAYLTDPYDPERAWSSMDGVQMDPKTGQPVARAKVDYLFAYGDHLMFKLQLDLQDVGEGDLDALSVLAYLLKDFQRGDIPVGGEKTSGFGWVQAEVAELDWLTASPEGVSRQLFGGHTLTQDGLWQRLTLEGPAAAEALQAVAPLASAGAKASPTPPRAQAGFVSHRAFGGYCGALAVAAHVLTPISISESGEPSFTASLEDGPVNGWDFFSMSPPDAARRAANRVYALPSKSIRGLLRHVYAIASDSSKESADIRNLNPTDSLFGWVGKGQNQALMGRVVPGFGTFDNPELAWFKVPFPYGDWQHAGGQWKNVPGSSTAKLRIGNNWRLFPHAPLAPFVKRLDDFRPDTTQAGYVRAILPGAQARFTIRFWNLAEAELQRLLWCVGLEQGLAHKMGKNRYLGFGSLRLQVLPDSFLIDWAKRYGDPAQDWRLPLQPDKWANTEVIAHYAELRKALDAGQL